MEKGLLLKMTRKRVRYRRMAQVFFLCSLRGHSGAKPREKWVLPPFGPGS